MSPGARQLWAVPLVIAVQQFIVAWPGDDVSAGPSTVFWFLVTVALTWAAAERRSSVAWGVLVAFGAWAVVVAVVGVAGGSDFAASMYLVLSAVVLSLLLSPAARAHLKRERAKIRFP